MSGDSWYSDAALAKQAALDAKDAAGEPVGFMDLLGIWEPRVPAAESEKCVHCRSDARPEVGGETHHGQRWCDLCVGRGRHEDGPR